MKHKIKIRISERAHSRTGWDVTARENGEASAFWFRTKTEAVSAAAFIVTQVAPRDRQTTIITVTPTPKDRVDAKIRKSSGH